jgi:hypothetical protein
MNVGDIVQHERFGLRLIMAEYCDIFYYLTNDGCVASIWLPADTNHWQVV